MPKKDKPQPPQFSDEELKMPEDSLAPVGTTENTPKRRILGPILAVLIVILILVLVGLYLWGTTLQNEAPATDTVPTRPSAEENNEPESNNAEANTQALRTVSNSDELSAIEADIEATNLDTLDAEMNAIEAEMDASAQ